MSIAPEARRSRASAGTRTGPRIGPLAALALSVVAAAVLLALPLRAPIGAMYWDVFVYFDAAGRVFDGQIPNVDFFPPVGPLGYYLFAAGLRIFGEAQPVLLAQYSILVFTAPAMALVLADLGRRESGMVWAILVPFLLFSLLPFNSLDYSLYPGIDGFGTYNRQTSLLIYVGVAAVLFIRDRGRLAMALCLVLTALFLTKVTGFLAFGLVLALAVLAGRIGLRVALVVASVFVLALSALEMTSGMISAYLADIVFLVRGNDETLLPRFLTVASQNFGVLAPAGIMVALLATSDLAGARRSRPAEAVSASLASRLLDRDWLWLGTSLLAAILFETQNTGSQSFIIVWPAILALLAAPGFASGRLWPALLVLAAFATVPTAGSVIERTARAVAAIPMNQPLAASHLGSLGRISAKTSFLEEAERKRAYQVAHRDHPLLEAVGADTHSYRPFADHDFQVLWLSTLDEAAGALLALEVRSGRRFETIFAMDFVNPMPWLLGRSATPHMPIGPVPGRTVKPLDDEMAAALAATDIVLVPRCAATVVSAGMMELYGAPLAGHERIELTPCFDALVRPAP